MATRARPKPRLTFHALTPERWPDLETLFGERGACGGCWCMWFRLARASFVEGKGEGNRRAFRKLVRSGAEPGILAYAGPEAVGWCALAPREHYPRLERSRSLAPIDDRPVWSVTCFFVARAWRRRGVTVELLKAALRHARERGAELVEGYPSQPAKQGVADAFAYMGVPSAFLEAGFRVVRRRSKSGRIVRRELRKATPAPRASRRAG